MKIQFDLEDIKKACAQYSKDLVMFHDRYEWKTEIRKGANGSFKGVDVYVIQKVKTSPSKE